MPSSAPVCNKDAYQQACAAEKSGDSPRFAEKVHVFGASVFFFSYIARGKAEINKVIRAH